MNLFDQISDDIKKAMLARDKVTLEALRNVKKEFLEAKTAKGGENFDDAAAQKIIQKMVKKGKDAAQIFQDQKREDLANEELSQVVVYEKYLPAQMSDAELENAIASIIAEVGAEGPKDMGKVMGTASKQLAGKADGRAISEKVKALLNK